MQIKGATFAHLVDNILSWGTCDYHHVDLINFVSVVHLRTEVE